MNGDDEMQNKLKLPALAGYVVVDGDVVTVMSDKDEVVTKVSLEEWETLRKELRFDDTVDYESGESPLSNYQFCSFVEMICKIKALEAEKERLLAEKAKG